MKFRKLIPLFVIAVLVAAYFTKPSRQDFMRYIQPVAAARGTAPVIGYEDKIIYAKASAFFISVRHQGNLPASASGTREEYIGAFKKFWKQNSTP